MAESRNDMVFGVGLWAGTGGGQAEFRSSSVVTTEELKMIGWCLETSLS